jgi:hypothetical protein
LICDKKTRNLYLSIQNNRNLQLIEESRGTIAAFGKPV